MISFFRSKSIHSLLSKLCGINRETLENKPFSSPWIITQNKEMQEWISLNSSLIEGINAHSTFLFPSELLWTLFRAKDADLSKILPSDRIPMSWHLFEVLSANNELMHWDESFKNSSNSSQSILQLSIELADVFDLYQMFRGDMIIGWENNVLETDSDFERWQAMIWRSLKARWVSLYPQFPTRAEAFSKIESWIKSGEIKHSILPEVIHVFNVNDLDATFLKVLEALSELVDVNIYVSNTFENNYSKTDDWTVWRNELITKKGKSISLLNSMSIDKREDLTEIKEAEVGSDLNQIQKSLRSGVLGELKLKQDSSFTIHSCHSPKREIEVLKDEILKTLSDDKNLTVDDILILVPNADKYNLIIKEVFENEDDLFIPVSTGFITNETSYLRAAETFIELISSDFKVSEIFSFIEIDVVRESLEISEDEIFQLQEHVKSNNIHWGINSDSPFSWDSGIIKLVAGYSMELESDELFNDLKISDNISGSSEAELVGKLSHLIFKLRSIRVNTFKKESILWWFDFFETSFSSILGSISIDSNAKLSFQKKLEKIKNQLEVSQSTSKVEYSVFKNWVISQLNDLAASSGRFGGGITISTYIPYQGIPFKYIAVLGLNESVFPRTIIRPEFDLVKSFPKPGDRTLEEDDAYLFYEFLLNAHKHLHLSYCGLDLYSKEKRLPSSLLQHLIDLISNKEDIDFHIKEHKLQPFNAYYFEGENAASFSIKNKKITEKLSNSTVTERAFFDNNEFFLKEILSDELTIKELISFFEHPHKHMSQFVLNISEYDGFEELKDREIFKTSGLEGYFLKEILFQKDKDLNRAEELKQIYKMVVSSGLVADDYPGELDFISKINELMPLYKELIKLKDISEKTIEIGVQVDDFRVSGTISNVYDHKLEIHLISSLKGKHLISAWIKHLFLKLELGDSFQGTQVCYLNSKKELQKSSFSLNIDAETEIKKLLVFFKSFRIDPIEKVFFSESSYHFAKSLYEDKGEEKAFESAESSWYGDDYNPVKSDSEDFYNSLFWRGESPIDAPKFKENALEVFLPLLNNLVEVIE